MSIWDEIKNKLSIEDVISDYVQIKPKGANFTCICPFHKEKTPSLIISPQKQIWHCFGCGAGGDIFSFVADIENIERSEAMKKLAKKANIELAKKLKSDTGQSSEQLERKAQNTSNGQAGEEDYAEESTTVNHYQKGQQLLEWAADLYHQILLKCLEDPNHPISQYCLERGLTRKIIKEFKLGFAPDRNLLTKLLASQPQKLQLAQEVGLINQRN